MAIFKYEDDIKLHLGIAHNENSDITDNIYNGPDAYKDLQFLRFNKSWENSALSLMLLNNGPYMQEDEQKNRYSQTIGGRYTTNIEEVKLAGNLYWQSGKHVSGAKISALNLLFEAASKILLQDMNVFQEPITTKRRNINRLHHFTEPTINSMVLWIIFMLVVISDR